MRIWTRGLAAALALILAPVPALAQSSSLAAGVNLGTPGVGAELQLQLSDSLVLRGDVDWLSYSRDEGYSGVDYDGKLKSTTAGLFADWHPGGGAFLISAGAYFGERNLDLTATPTGNVTIGGQTFTPAQVGRIDGRAEMSSFQPFLGIGFDNTFSREGPWGFRALAGVAFSGEPDVNLTASGGTFSNDPTFQARLQQEEAEVREDVEAFRYYPVLQIGLTRRF
jgi:hypothetical protein